MSFLSEIFNKKPRNLNIKVLSPEAFNAKISKQNVQLVDVRTPQEYNMQHLKNAININFYSGNFDNEFDKLNKLKPLFIYCRSGKRSRQASYKLFGLGFKEIYDLQGGLLNWKY